MYFETQCIQLQGRTQAGIKGFLPQKLPKLDLTADAKYVADLVNANMWL